MHLNKKCWHLPIFPGRHQPSIFGTIELNFRVRYGNGWTLNVFNTNFLLSHYITFYFSLQAFSLFFTHFFLLFFLLGVFPLHRTLGDSYGNRTRVSGVRGRCLNRLTNEPSLFPRPFLAFSSGAPSGTRTRDTLIKSQVLYHLS